MDETSGHSSGDDDAGSQSGGKPCDSEENYQTCDSDNGFLNAKHSEPQNHENESVAETIIDSSVMANMELSGTEVTVLASGGSESSESQQISGNYMPAESLDSDNSDVAGYYEVNEASEARDMMRKRHTYQRGRIESSTSESSDDFMIRRRPLSVSTSSSSADDTDSERHDAFVLVKTQTRSHRFLLRDWSRREFGDFGCNKYRTRYTTNMMGNQSFVRRLKCAHKLNYHRGCVNALHWNSSGSLLASGSDDQLVAIWDARYELPYFSFDTGHHNNVFQCKFMPHSNDSQIVTCSRDGQVRLAELSAVGECRGTKKLAQHRGSVHKLAVEADSPHCLLSAGEDSVIIQIDLRQNKPIRLAMAKNGRRKVPLYSIDKNPTNAHEFLVSGRDQYIRIYDKRQIGERTATDDSVLKRFCPHKMGQDSPSKRDVTCAVYNFDGTEVLGTYNDEDIHLFDNRHSDKADCIKTYTGHRNSATVKGVNFYGPRSEYVVSGSDCGHVFIWDKQSAEVVQFAYGDEGGVVNVLEPHPHFPLLATSGLDHDIKLWMPLEEAAVPLKGLRKQCRKNLRERDAFQTPHDQEDSRLLWLIMQHLRQRHPRNQGNHEEDDEDNASESSDMTTDEDEDSSQPMPASVGCNTS